jgi:membrane fusion protein, protease secretion system
MSLPARFETGEPGKRLPAPLQSGTVHIDVPAAPDSDYRRPIRLGVAVLIVGLGGFLAWAALAPLDEGVPAPGVISVESMRKRVEHLEGGIVEKILVRDGSVVRAGEEVVVLREVQAKASLNAGLSQWRIALATEARLTAEKGLLRAIAFPKDLTDHAADPDVAAAMRGQEELFRSRRNALDGELRILRENVAGLEAQLKSLEQLRQGREKQLQLFEEQLASHRSLNQRGFVSRNQLLDLERQFSEVQSKQGEDLANIASVRSRLAEFRMRAGQREAEYRREIEVQLADVQRDLGQFGEKLAGLRDTHARLVIRAPVSGTVVGLAVHTVGGVVKAGDRVMDIVPAEDQLIVEALVAPQYIDRVRAGLPADVYFDAYMSRVERPMVRGTVAVVSADVMTDPRNGRPYYAVRVVVANDELARLRGLKLQPGMEGNVMVKTGERTLLVYLARPLLRRFGSALSET